MKKGSLPYVLILILPGASIGLLWSFNMTLIPLLAKLYTVDERKIGILISMGAFTGIFMQYIAGMISDRSHFKMGKRRPFMLVAGILTAIALCIMPYSTSYTMLFASSFMFYFILNFFQGPYYALVPESVEPNRLGFTYGIGRIIGTLTGGFIFYFGVVLWNMYHPLPFYVGGLIMILTVLLCVFFINEDETKTIRANKLAFDFYKFPSVMKLFLTAFFVFMCLGCITSFFVIYCDKRLGINAEQSGLSLLLLTIVGAASAYPIGLWLDRSSHKRVLIASIITFILGVIAAMFVKTALHLYIIMSFMGIGYVGIQVSLACILPEIVPAERLGEFMGIYNLFISLPQFIGTNMMGFILHKLGYSYFFPVALVSIFVAAAIAFSADFKKYKQPA